MDWDAIAAVSEILGTIAVIVSLVYLAIQMRNQSRETLLWLRRFWGHRKNWFCSEFRDFVESAFQSSESVSDSICRHNT